MFAYYVILLVSWFLSASAAPSKGVLPTIIGALVAEVGDV
jgi:hypothetical protein